MILVGLGEAGKNIAKLFAPHTKNYKIIIFDENDGIDFKNTVEEYDEVSINIDKKVLKSHDEAILFVCGSGKIAGASLRVLEALSSVKTTVVYIRPDIEFLSEEEKKRHKVHFGVLQQFARSGRFSEMMVFDNKTLIEIAGAGTIRDYYKKVNYFVYSTLQNLLYCENTKPDFNKLHKRRLISRISTVGFGKFEENEEKLLFALDNVTETCYYINIDEDDLNNDEQIIPRCQQIVRENKEKERETSYAIWNSSDGNHFYVKHYTHFIQEP